VLQWANAKGCPWNESTCDAAAEGNHLELLQWAMEGGCEGEEHTLLEIACECRFDQMHRWLVWVFGHASEYEDEDGVVFGKVDDDGVVLTPEEDDEEEEDGEEEEEDGEEEEDEEGT
jgi:hypothetical protein